MDNIILTDIIISSDSLLIQYRSSEKIEAWLENTNKHYPHILSLNCQSQEHEIIIEKSRILSFLEHYPGHHFQLSLCNTTNRLVYTVSDKIREKLFLLPCFSIKKNVIILSNYVNDEGKMSVASNSVEIRHLNNSTYINIDKLPVNLLSIGSCFSRSIFRSDPYFNPSYKNIFRVKRTLFHDSFISLFSEPISCDYSSIEDLITGDAGKYVGVEFEKNIEQILKDTDCRIIVVDNYIDAAVPVIRFSKNGYLTYNKYFSESIFKRYFSSCDVIYPGTEEHASLYQKSLSVFHQLLISHGIFNIVLVGGRLSRYKIDERTQQIDVWDDKMEWITEVNHCWDIADSLFLQEFPNAIYLDKRHPLWKSDICSPIIGGASPSHYQSGYYKELFEDLLQFISEDIINGQ